MMEKGFPDFRLQFDQDKQTDGVSVSRLLKKSVEQPAFFAGVSRPRQISGGLPGPARQGGRYVNTTTRPP